jgi:hypothetical protein
MTYPVAGRMADSTRPELIPDKYALRPNGVLVYADGPYKWPSTQIRRFPRRWSITVTGDPEMCREARCIDVERFDATPADIYGYAEARGKNGDSTVVYCDRATVPQVVAAYPGWRNLLWFIATLDGVAWNPATLASDIRDNEGVDIEPADIRAIQNVEAGNYDSSLIFGNPYWTTDKEG